MISVSYECASSTRTPGLSTITEKILIDIASCYYLDYMHFFFVRFCASCKENKISLRLPRFLGILAFRRKRVFVATCVVFSTTISKKKQSKFMLCKKGGIISSSLNDAVVITSFHFESD